MQLPCGGFNLSFFSGEDSDWTSKLLSLVLGPIAIAGRLPDQGGPGLTHLPTSGPGSCAEFQKGIANTRRTWKKEKIWLSTYRGRKASPKPQGLAIGHRRGKVGSNEMNLLLQLCWVCRRFLHRNASDMIAMEGLSGLKKRGQAGRSVTEFCTLFLMGKISILWIC